MSNHDGHTRTARIVRAGDRVRCSSNAMTSRVVAATKQWVILVNDSRPYLRENPKEKGRQWAVHMDNIADIIPKRKK